MNTDTSPLKILIADDHALFREGMRHTLQQLDKNAVVIETCDYSATREQLASHPDLDLALIDLNMPTQDKTANIDTLLAESPTVPIVVLSASEDRRDIRRALEAGAMGFIPKSESAEVMLGALHLVLSGGIYVPPILVRSDDTARNGDLTPRQRDVLREMAGGKSNREIGEHLGLSEATVKVHITAIFKCLNVTNRGHAVVAARQRGLAGIPPSTTNAPATGSIAESQTV